MVCAYCKKEDTRKRIKGAKYCSRACYYKGRSDPYIQKTCLNCDKPFSVPPCFKRVQHCSRKCGYATRAWRKSGKNHPRWKGGHKGWGTPNCMDCNKKLRNYTAKRCAECFHKYFQGENHASWRGGRTPENLKIRKSTKMKQWRTAVFERDDYTCQRCGIRGGRLNADHDLPFVAFEDLRFELLNGQTLCVECHRKDYMCGQKDYFRATGIYLPPKELLDITINN